MVPWSQVLSRRITAVCFDKEEPQGAEHSRSGCVCLCTGTVYRHLHVCKHAAQEGTAYTLQPSREGSRASSSLGSLLGCDVPVLLSS